MQVNLIRGLLQDGDTQRAEEILNACVHCGFCTATCPTYVETGNELDSPRGRIYLIKEMLETGRATAVTRRHLDRCVTCQSCETTCPSGVDYHHLVAIGRHTSEQLAPRNPAERLMRAALRRLLLSPRLLRILLALGRACSPLLPAAVRRTYFPLREPDWLGTRVAAGDSAQGAAVILVPGCIQPSLRPETDQALARILDHFAVPLLAPGAAGCCGAASFHTSGEDQARALARRNIDCWWQLYQQREVRAIVTTASGCGVHLQDYPALLQADPIYGEKARALAHLVRDPVELLEELSQQQPGLLPRELGAGKQYAFHCPCTLQHGQGLNGRVERLLMHMGVALPTIEDAHLCCGSAGTYSLLQPTMARALRAAKLRHLQATGPDVIVTANIGCQLHLQGGTGTPVRHWLELVADALDQPHAE
ncbi:glycolate oxidase subunit GlcF [Microbulbifer sp. TYP-18]|uniref:glycolate oxidase subunit GlcF n=1 Tax=Microbulbifer sp. TYP-18 TaxID=3230024 RepID=UPI0034C66EAC